jgi:hypothetical protein
MTTPTVIEYALMAGAVSRSLNVRFGEAAMSVVG